LLAHGPRAVIAIDRSAAQLACLALRVAAYRKLDDDELVAFLGARPTPHRAQFYARCRPELGASERDFWDERPRLVADGVGNAGRFESYLTSFRRWILPLVHDREQIAELLAPKSRAERERFFVRTWDTPRWRMLFALFFSRAVMGRLGRERVYFAHAQANLVTHLAERVRYALVELDPATNPYLQWILTGGYGDALPFALRPPNIARIRRYLDRLQWQRCSLETFVGQPGGAIDRFALSDVFEYVDAENYAKLLGQIVDRSARGARLAYWNMLVDRTRPEELAAVLIPREAEAARLHARDNAFFYRRFVIEDVR